MNNPMLKSILTKKGLALAIVIVLLHSLIACETTQPMGTPTATHKQSATTPINTNPPALTATLMPTPTNSVINNAACWPMQVIGKRLLSGSLLYIYMIMDRVTGAPTAGGPGAFNLKAGYSKGLEKFLPRNISPDGKILTEFTESKWVFLTQNGEVSYPIPDTILRKGSTYMFLPNDQMLWVGPSLNQKNTPSNLRDMYLFSPTTGKLTFVQSVSLPDNLWNPSKLHNDYLAELYSPDLKYVLYPANYQNTNISILLNIKSQGIVWYGWSGSDLGFYRPPLPYYTIETPVWRRDSSGVIFHRVDEKTGIQNLYNLSVDGQVSQLTHLEELFPGNKYVISSLSLSPNGQYLAFAVAQDSDIFPGRNSLLLILDLGNETITNPCVTLANSPYPGRPVWSPDSSAIAIVPDAGNSIVAVDLNKKTLFNIFPKTGLDSDGLLGWINWEIP